MVFLRTPIGLLAALVLPAALLLVVAAGCGGDTDASSVSGDLGEPLDPTERDIADLRVPGVAYDEHGDPQGLHRYIRWSAKLGQGAQPQGEVAFEQLAALGYKTVLSVDGAIPEVELAKKHGLRYVHVPIGYDGVPQDALLQILKTTELDGPIYVHCHHGKHRGPCAAQLMRIHADGVTPGEGIRGLERSGTNRDYRGLWHTVVDFREPKADAIEAVETLREAVIPEGVRAGMVDMNVRYDHLKMASRNAWKATPEHPDVSPAHEAKMLWELFREMGRNDPEAKAQGDVFLAYLRSSEEATIELEKAIRAGDVAAAKKHFGVVKQLCADCHRDYRN